MKVPPLTARFHRSREGVRPLLPQLLARWCARASAIAAILMATSCGRPAPTLPSRPDVSGMPAGFATALTGAEARARDEAGRPGPAWLELAQLYHANGCAEQARPVYQALVDRPDVGAKACYGLALLAGEDLDEARQWLARTVRVNPDYVPARLRWAETLYKSGDTAAAMAEYATVLRQEPANPQASLATAREALRTGDLAAAAAQLRELTQRHPEFLAGCALYAQVLQRQGEAVAAEAMRRRASAHKDAPPSDPWRDEMLRRSFDLQKLGMLFEDYSKAARVDEAMTWLQRIEEVDPNHWLVRQIRGLSLAQQGRLEEAAAEYRQALDAGGDGRRLYPAVIGVLVQLKRFDQADALAGRGLAAAPDTPALLVAVAQLREAQGRQPEAETLLQQALAIEPRQTAANRALGLIWWSRGEQARALPLLRIAIETAPSDAITRALVAQYLLEQNQPADAARLLNEARTATPDDPRIRDLLALAQLRLGNQAARSGRINEALVAYDAALAVKPDSVEALNNKARVSLQAGRREPAEAALRRLAAVAPNNPALWLALGDVQHELGRAADARASWTKAAGLLGETGEPEMRQAVAQRLGLNPAPAVPQP